MFLGTGVMAGCGSNKAEAKATYRQMGIEYMEQGDYAKAVEELEAIAEKVEDPHTAIEDIDKYIRRSEELVGKCRAYLRGAREKLDSLSA